jgi:ribonuclease T
MNNKKELFISVDVETAGPIPGEYSLLSIGACNAEDDIESFYVELKPINRNAVPEALKVTGLSLDKLGEHGITPSDAMKDFANWIARITGDDTPVFVGFNAPFDWSFVNYYFHKFIGNNPFGFTALDIKALYMGATGSSWSDTRSSRIAERLRPQQRGNHDALRDARYQAELFRLVRGKVSKPD